MSDEQVKERIASLSGWSVQDGKLAKGYVVNDFAAGIAFVNRVAAVAKAEGHDPDIFLGGNQVTVYLTTHSAGGLTAKDFATAAAIDKG